MRQNSTSQQDKGFQYGYGKSFDRRGSTRRLSRRRQHRLILLTICAALTLLLLVLVIRLFVGAVSCLHTAADFGTAQYDLSDYTFNAADPNLLLVNNNMPLAEGYVPETVNAANGKPLAVEAAEAYRQMAEAAKQDGVSLILTSGYRDFTYQNGLFEKRIEKFAGLGYNREEAAALAQTVVAKPGCSEHQTGLAADIVTERYQSLDSGFAKTDAFLWLHRYAADYGFILRYPEERQRVTGIIYEPWHWRYVGTANAQAITQSGLSLEEFIAIHTTASDIAMTSISASDAAAA